MTESRKPLEPSSVRPEAYDADVRVGMGEWSFVSGDQTIGTVGLGPCIGLALYDSESQTGYMAHTESQETDTIETMLSRVSAHNSSNLRAWLSGGGLVESYGDEKVRDDVVQLIIDAGVKEGKLEVEWVESGEMAEMLLDCKTGNCAIVKEDINDYLDDFS